MCCSKFIENLEKRFFSVIKMSKLLNSHKLPKKPIPIFDSVRKSRTLLYFHHFLTSDIRSKISPQEMETDLEMSSFKTGSSRNEKVKA